MKSPQSQKMTSIIGLLALTSQSVLAQTAIDTTHERATKKMVESGQAANDGKAAVGKAVGAYGQMIQSGAEGVALHTSTLVQKADLFVWDNAVAARSWIDQDPTSAHQYASAAESFISMISLWRDTNKFKKSGKLSASAKQAISDYQSKVEVIKKNLEQHTRTLNDSKVVIKDHQVNINVKEGLDSFQKAHGKEYSSFLDMIRSRDTLSADIERLKTSIVQNKETVRSLTEKLTNLIIQVNQEVQDNKFANALSPTQNSQNAQIANSIRELTNEAPQLNQLWESLNSDLNALESQIKSISESSTAKAVSEAAKKAGYSADKLANVAQMRTGDFTVAGLTNLTQESSAAIEAMAVESKAHQEQLLTALEKEKINLRRINVGRSARVVKMAGVGLVLVDGISRSVLLVQNKDPGLFAIMTLGNQIKNYINNR